MPLPPEFDFGATDGEAWSWAAKSGLNPRHKTMKVDHRLMVS